MSWRDHDLFPPEMKVRMRLTGLSTEFIEHWSHHSFAPLADWWMWLERVEQDPRRVEEWNEDMKNRAKAKK